MLTFHKLKTAALRVDATKELSLADWQMISPLNDMFYHQMGRHMDHDDDGNYKADMGESLTLLRRLTEFMNEAYEVIVNAEYRYMVVAPIRPRTDSGARRIGWLVAERMGEMKILARGARDLPELTANLKEKEVDIEIGGARVTFAWEDIEAALFQGRSLPFDAAAIGRMAADDLLERITAYGDKQSGLGGMLSKPSALNGLPSLNWAGLSTPQDKVDALRSVVNASNSASGFRLPSNTLLLPSYILEEIEQLNYGQSNQFTTVYEYLMLIFKRRGLKIIDWEKLKGVKAPGINNKDVVMAYPFRFEVLENLIVNPFFMKPMKEDENYDVSGGFYTKTAGVAFRQPKSVTWAPLN